MKIVFMGTPEFAVPVLKALADAGHEIGYVVTQPDRARNRNQVTFSAVKTAALELGIEVLQPEKLRESAETREKLAAFGPDVIVVVAYGQILKPDILELPEYGCFNVHGSLLPRFRGASPMQHAILEGDEKTGVTIMKMAEGLDSGDMVASSETPVDHKNFEDIHDELAAMGAALIVETLPLIEAGKADFVPQDESLVTYAPIINKKDGRVDFSKKPEEIERQIRAFDPWPGAFCDFGGKQMKLWQAECPDMECGLMPGTVTAASEAGIDVACGGRILRITELQIAGKKRVSAGDFLRGHKVEAGTVLL